MYIYLNALYINTYPLMLKKIIYNNQAQLFVIFHIISELIISIHSRLYAPFLGDGLFTALISMFTFFILIITSYKTKFDNSKSKIPDILRGIILVISWRLLSHCLNIMPFIEVIASIVMYPMLSSIFFFIFLKEKFTLLKCSSIIGGIIGSIIILYPNPNELSYSAIEILCILFIMCLWVAFDFISKKYTYPHGSTLSAQTFIICIAFFTINIPQLALITEIELKFIISKLYIFSFLGLALWVYIYSSLSYIAKCKEITSITPIYALDIAFASLASFFIFNETMHFSTIIGIIIVLASSAIMFKIKNKD